MLFKDFVLRGGSMGPRRGWPTRRVPKKKTPADAVNVSLLTRTGACLGHVAAAGVISGAW